MFAPRPWIVVRLRSLPLSFRLDRHVPLVMGLLTALALLLFILNISWGEYPVPPLAMLQAIFGLSTDADHEFVVRTLRLPRSLVALLVGMGLAIAGGILQGITRNPLAAPEIIGVNAGASLVAVTFIVLLPGISPSLLPVAAFCGGLTAAIAIYVLAWNQGSAPVRLILVGIGLAALASSLTSLMVTFGEISVVSQALVWLTGSVHGRGWEHLLPLLPWLALFIPLSLALARELDTLNLGDNLARGLGSRVEWRWGLLLVCSVALAGSCVATAGNIGFVGLMAPHLARHLVGPSHGGMIPVAALTGACITELADLIGRTVFAPIEIPCGVITAIVGAPYFLWLLYRNRNQ